MRTKQELYQAALRTVALRRQTARANAEDARLEAEAAIPALRHAEDEVRVRGIRCALAGAAGKDRTEAAAALSKARQELTALLAASGRPADALAPKFTCKLCQDTGSVQGRTCTCVHKLMQGLRREEIEALSSLSISSFDTMELRYYPNTVDEKLGEPVRTYMGGLLEDLRSYAEEFDHNSENLMLFGNAGLGKTHAALAIAGIVLQPRLLRQAGKRPLRLLRGCRDPAAHSLCRRSADPGRSGHRIRHPLLHHHFLQPAE